MILKIISVMVVCFIGISVFSGLMSIVSINQSQDHLERTIAENLQNYSNQVMDTMERDVSSKIKEFKAFSNISEYHQIIINSNEQFSQMDNPNEIIEIRNFQWISPSQTTEHFMVEIMNNKLSEALQDKVSFYESEEGYRVFGEIFVTNAYGVNVAQTGKTEDYRQDDEIWWQQAKIQGVFVENVEYDPSSNLYSVDIGIRIDNQNGDFIGVMKIVLNVEELIYIIREAERNFEYDTLKIGWFNKDGEIIYDPHIHPSQSEQVPDFFSHIDFEKKYFFYTPQGMEPQLFTFASSQYLFDLEGLDWILVLHLDTEEVYFSVNEQKNYILIITVLVVLISSVVGVIVSKTLSRPISDLRKFADEISEGKQAQEIPLTGPDEIQGLTKDIKKMKRDLEDQKNQLITSERMSAIGELAAKISHDIRNPLSNIRMAKELLSSRIENNEKNKELLQSMDNGIKRISHQVEDVLGYVKYTELDKKDCDLQEILQNVLSSIKIPKNVEVNFSKTKVKINADSDALFRIFQNLIINSIQSIGNKNGQIGIEIIEEENSVIINVQDSGDIIFEQDQKHIFEPLYTTKSEGTGLGLSTVKNLVEQHQGTINFKNNPTTFIITLPIKIGAYP